MSQLKSCHCCGLIQQAPSGVGAICMRCETALESWLGRLTGNGLSAAFAVAALLLYLPAVTLPFLRIEQLGQAHESSLLVGVKTLFTEGQVLVGIIVLVFSIILPLLKLSALLFLSQRRWQLAEKHRALTYRVVEQLGRWGMLDVLLVAVMVAFIKLGGLVEFHAGPGIVAFTMFVLVSLLASATFDPHVLWAEGVMLADDTDGEDAASKPASGTSDAAKPEPAGQMLPAAIVPKKEEKGWQPYAVWLIPGIATVVVGWILWDSFADRGRLIEIAFADGRGIEAGDELRYHGIVAGEVESVTLNDDLTGVDVTVRLTPESDRLAREGTRFWIVRPQADLTGIAGLETVVGSKYLTLLPGPADAAQVSEFNGLEDPPLVDLEFPGGLEIVLHSTEAFDMRTGLGVFYRSIRIGGVIETGLAGDGSSVETRVYIRPDYRHLIREKTVFWNAGGIQVVGGFTEMSVHIGTIETMIRGGIGVSIPPDAGDEASLGQRFELFDRPEKEWLKWQPSVVSRRAPPPEPPQLLEAILSWTHDGVINRKRTQTGWVLPTDAGLIGPRDLLAVPDEKIVEGTLQLEVDGKVIEPADASSSGNERVLLLRAGVPAAGFRQRAISAAEEGYLVSGTGRTVFLTAARYWQDGDQGFEVDDGLAVDASHHGGVLVAAADGSVIGMVTVDDDGVRIWPLPGE